MEERITYSSLVFDEEKHQKFEEALAHRTLGLHVRPRFADGPTLIDRDPSDTSVVLAKITQHAPDDVERVVELASSTCSSLKALGWEGRLEVLTTVREIITRGAYDIAALLTYEAGKTRAEALAEVYEVVAMIDVYEMFLREHNFYRYELADGMSAPYEQTTISMEPLGGPVGVIVPFNFPFALCANMAMSAFLAGNPVILKAPEDCPLSTLTFGNIMVEALKSAGLSPDACICLVGPGETVGDTLVRNPKVAKIGFTGSREVGTSINLIRTQMGMHDSVVAELGGKNPIIVTANADIKAAAHGIVKSVVGYTGQKCSSTSRVYVDVNVMDDLVAMMYSDEIVGSIFVGDPKLRETVVGPLINATARKRFEDLFKVIYERFERGEIAQYSLHDTKNSIHGDMGHFAPPVVVTGISHNDPIARDEHFVPIVTVHPVESLEEALLKANDTQYGLTAGIFSEDEEEIDYFFNNIEAGVVYSNRKAGGTTGAWPTIQTFGGWKNSGIGGVQGFGPYYLLKFARQQCRTWVSW